LKKSEQCVDLTSFSERLSKEQVFLEKLMLGLRQRKGISIIELEKELKNKEVFFERVKLLEKKGLVKKRNDRLYLTLDGLSLENEIILKLCNL
jgi:coproporphyrinogen III oxidase-like Fe-S oxidoreductase